MITTRTLRRRFFSMAGRLTRSARCLTLHLPKGLALANPVHSRPGSIASPAVACLTEPSAPDPSTRLPNRLEDSCQVDPRASHAACCPDHLAQHRYHGLPTSPLRGYRTLNSAKSIGIKASLSLSLASHPSTDRHGYILRVDSG